ncbi:nuclear transport factor 2 family protein [uncultured Jatrophihabitans sp.]|uniref:nuclear transport factor 2 family protein n=1 Tax=uncultured Jatrophihabitans sp. TaxID=1610747 RepID=UPI0035CBF5D4
MELWELLAREQIRHTVSAYAVAGDSGRVDELAAQFTDDGVLDVSGKEQARGRDQIVAMLARHAANGAPPPGDGDGVPFFIRHFVTNIAIQQISRTEARAVAYFAVFTPDGPDHWGRYRDVFVPDGDRWLLQHRTARVDSSVEGGWYRRTFALVG